MSDYTLQISKLIYKIIESHRIYFNGHIGILLYLQWYHTNSLPTNLVDVLSYCCHASSNENRTFLQVFDVDIARGVLTNGWYSQHFGYYTL